MSKPTKTEINTQPTSLDDAAAALTELDKLALEQIQGGAQPKPIGGGPNVLRPMAYHY